MSSYKNKNLNQYQQNEQLKSELERETAKLLAERRSLEGRQDNRSDNRHSIRQIYS